MTLITPTINDQVAQTQQECAAQLVELGTLRAQAQREFETCTARMAVLEHRMSAMQVATTSLAGMAPLGPLSEWRDHLVEWRTQLCDELLASSQHPPADRASMERQTGLRLSIMNVDRGCSHHQNGAPALGAPLASLIRAAGYEPLAWFGSVQEVDRKIKEWTRRRDEAQTMLDDALLDDDARAKREAESAARVAASRALPQRKTRDDGTQYNRWPDGRVVEVTS